MYDPTKDYSVLRWIAGMFFVLGVIVIVGGSIFSIGVFSSARELTSTLFASDGGPRYPGYTSALGLLAAVLSFLFWFGVGLMQIVVGYLIDVFLDLRDDTRKMLMLMGER